MKVPISATIRLNRDGTSEIIKEEFVDVPVTERLVRLYLSLLGTTPEEVVAKVMEQQRSGKAN